jgi:hypothetical protein
MEENRSADHEDSEFCPQMTQMNADERRWKRFRKKKNNPQMTRIDTDEQPKIS